MNKYNIKPGDKVVLDDMSNHMYLSKKYKKGDIVTVSHLQSGGFNIKGEADGLSWERAASLYSTGTTEPVIQLWPLNTLN